MGEKLSLAMLSFRKYGEKKAHQLKEIKRKTEKITSTLDLFSFEDFKINFVFNSQFFRTTKIRMHSIGISGSVWLCLLLEFDWIFTSF